MFEYAAVRRRWLAKEYWKSIPGNSALEWEMLEPHMREKIVSFCAALCMAIHSDDTIPAAEFKTMQIENLRGGLLAILKQQTVDASHAVTLVDRVQFTGSFSPDVAVRDGGGDQET